MSRYYLFAILLLLLLPIGSMAVPPTMTDVMPIARAIEIVEDRYHGRMIGAEVREDDDRPVYGFRWLTPDGNVLNIELDARSGDFLLIDGVGQTDARILP